MVPEFSVSAGVAYAFANTSLALQARWVGEQFLIGDEGNDAPFRRLDRYSLVDLRIERWLGRATAYLELSNLFDRRYSPFGIISRNVRDAEQVERFLTPGLPRALRVGLRVQSGR
jgi:outer membrane receptor protein involved in Fe transport